MSSVSDVFTTVISTEKQTLLIAAIQTILDSDKSIQDSVQIGYLPTYTKGRMKNATTVDPIEFIANALFCVCNQQNNTDGKADIKKINDDFIKKFTIKSSFNNASDHNQYARRSHVFCYACSNWR